MKRSSDNLFPTSHLVVDIGELVTMTTLRCCCTKLVPYCVISVETARLFLTFRECFDKLSRVVSISVIHARTSSTRMSCSIFFLTRHVLLFESLFLFIFQAIFSGTKILLTYKSKSKLTDTLDSPAFLTTTLFL